MDADERDIITFLKSWQGQFVSAKEVCKRAGGKWRYRNEPDWALPMLARLVERGELEADSTGHFRLRPKEKKEDKKWISPHLKQILEKSGQQFDGVISVDEEGNDLGSGSG